jgi:hypothetical protein
MPELSTKSQVIIDAFSDSIPLEKLIGETFICGMLKTFPCMVGQCCSHYQECFPPKKKRATAKPKPISIKKCSRCGVEKPLSEFSRALHFKDGHKTQCKECCAILTKEYKLIHPPDLRSFVPTVEITKANRAYINARNALIPEAEAWANQIVGICPKHLIKKDTEEHKRRWTKTYLAKMTELARERGI